MIPAMTQSTLVLGAALVSVLIIVLGITDIFSFRAKSWSEAGRSRRGMGDVDARVRSTRRSALLGHRPLRPPRPAPPRLTPPPGEKLYVGLIQMVTVLWVSRAVKLPGSAFQTPAGSGLGNLWIILGFGHEVDFIACFRPAPQLRRGHRVRARKGLCAQPDRWRRTM